MPKKVNVVAKNLESYRFPEIYLSRYNFDRHYSNGYVMIHPATSDIPRTVHPKQRAEKICNCLQRWFTKFSRLWSAIHISYRGGKYSVERLLALDEYTQSHSTLHVFFVCITSFLPAECFIISQEAVPLQDPALGYRENYGFWFRAALVIGAVFYTVTIQAKYLLKAFIISRYQQVALLICVVFVQMTLAVTFAAKIWFPIPFTVITLVPAFYIVSIGSVCLVMGISVIREVIRHKEQLVHFVCFIAAQQFMAVIYPAYQVLFHAVNNTSYQLPVILLLPVIKLIVKNIVLRCVAHMEDMMPEAVIFTVDFFNALYMATSMESATSTSTVIIIVLIDVTQSASVLYRLHRRTSTILRRLNQFLDPIEEKKSFLTAASQICRCGDKFQKQNRKNIQIRSCLHHSLAIETRELLDRLERIPQTGNRRRYTAPYKQIILEARQRIDRGATWAERPAEKVTSPPKARRPQPKVRQDKSIVGVQVGVLREALEILFTVECILLSAFLDAFVPLFYGIFMFVMVNFQSVKYHSELVGVTKETIGDMVDSIFVFSFVELVALCLVAALVYRNLRINAVYHLAFVLESQTELIQTKLLAWVTMTLAFRVVHFGVDFTFKFEWLGKK